MGVKVSARSDLNFNAAHRVCGDFGQLFVMRFDSDLWINKGGGTSRRVTSRPVNGLGVSRSAWGEGLLCEPVFSEAWQNANLCQNLQG